MIHLTDINNELSLLNKLSPKKRLDAILGHSSPLKLVRSMPVTDLLLTIRQIGFESSLELIEMMHPKQIAALFDLEIWTNDQLNLEQAGGYLSLLFAASKDAAVAQIHGLDIELVGLMLKNVANIYDTSLNEEPVDFPDLYSTSPDGRFIVCFIEDESTKNLAAALHTFLEELYGRDLPFVLRLLETLRFELPSDLEELSLRWRESRLLDLGIMPREERLAFFAPLAMAEVRRIMASPQQQPPSSPENFHLRPLATSCDGRYPFLRTALEGSLDEHKELFWLRLKHAVINMHASLSGDFGDEEAIINTAEYSKFLAELGLMQLCQGSINHGTDIITKTAPKYLIRLGRTALVAMRKRLRTALADGALLLGHEFRYADSPLREMARALCLPEPRYYEGLLEPEKLIIRHFASINELNATLHAVNELIFRAQLIGRHGFGVSEDMMGTLELSHAGIVARVLINQYAGRTELLAEIKPQEIGSIIGKSGGLSRDFTLHTRQCIATISGRLSTTLAQDPEAVDTKAQNFLNAVLAQLERNPSLLLG